MNKYDRFYDEACNEARDVINEWMKDRLRSELDDDDDDDDVEASSFGRKWHQDSDVFLQNYLKREDHNFVEKPKESSSVEVDLYEDDEDVAVNHLLSSMRIKLASSSLKDYELQERKKKPVQTKDPRITMELRQKLVKEARMRRNDEIKKKRIETLERKERDTLAKRILEKEMAEKVLKEKIEEETIQREMAKIRKRMQEIKQSHNNVREVKIEDQTMMRKEEFVRTKHDLVSPHFIPGTLFHSKVEESNDHLKEKELKLESHHRHQLMRKYLHHWMKVVMSQRAALGKAKALSDWHSLMRHWSAWKKYCLEAAASRDTMIHEENMKKMRIYESLAKRKCRKLRMRKCFKKWKEYVKQEQYSKELLKEQNETKKKMQALLGAVASQAKENVVLYSLDDHSTEEVVLSDQHVLTSGKRFSSERSSKSNIRSNPPKQAWQVNKGDVRKLTVAQMENLKSLQAPPIGIRTQVNSFKEDGPNNSLNHRYKASKDTIAMQRVMIDEQKQIIEEQKRLLDKKMEYFSKDQTIEEESVVSVMSSEKKNMAEKFKRPKSLLAMEKRAEERRKRKSELEAKKKEVERARIEELHRQEEERMKKEEEEKKAKAEELKRIKLLEIQKENERKALIAKMRELAKIAERHYERNLLQKYGIQPWKKLMKDQERRIVIAKFHYEEKLCKNMFETWHDISDGMKLKDEEISSRFYRKLLLKRCLNNWLKYGESVMILEKKAEMFNHHRLKVLYLGKWERFVTNQQLDFMKKEEVAANHDILRMKRRVFSIIRHHKESVKRIEVRNRRIHEMRRKVTQLLPDFNPHMSG